ncbi:MAG TPA: AarF/UbiB family protein [Gemmatimonadaceae bacterium]|nr:AarF/UbiB family protein [Gemmatimonadaceae bacterium]
MTKAESPPARPSARRRAHAPHTALTARETARPPLELMKEGPPPGLVRRLFVTVRHAVGLMAGGIVARANASKAHGARAGPREAFIRVIAVPLRPLLLRELREAPFPVQLRRRLELLGPTYIKLGQILSLREDILPRSVTSELRRLLNQLPIVPFPRYRELVEDGLGRPITAMFSWIDPVPLGSASIAQIHRARTLDGAEVVLKVVKPGIRDTLHRDARLLRGLGRLLEVVVPHYQPRRIISEFVSYTEREVDLRREASNATTFRVNFADMPDVVFPAIYTQYSGESVLCMEFLDGPRPDDEAARTLPVADRERLLDRGAASIIRMIYRDGFFHADLHPGNLLVLPGPKVGFIDLGMVGHLDAELRRLLLFYYYSLVTGDAESAARYLGAVAEPGRGADPAGFRREVTEISGRWRNAATFDSFSLAQLVLESVTLGAQYRMYFPMEMVLMVKALITFEGVGQVMLPGIDIARVSRAHIRRIFLEQFNPVRIVREELKSAPDLVDALAKMPLLITEGVRVLERSTQARAPSPMAGLRGALLAGFSIVAGALVLALRGPWPAWTLLFTAGLAIALRGAKE